MQSLTLQSGHHDDVARAIAGERWVVACLCAAWCGTCGSYRAAFEELAQRHPDKVFVWIDIEDNADVVGDLDVENFPTLLVQRADAVAFFGTVLPDPNVADRMIEALASQTPEETAHQAASTEERRTWQRDANLRALLAGAD